MALPDLMTTLMTDPVRPQHTFDESRLVEYLAQHIPECSGDIRVTQYEGGQSNPTFLIETDTLRLVMRKKPPGELLPKAHQIEREYRVMSALQNSDVPVPKTYLVCEDDSIIGTPFYIVGHVEGRIVRAIKPDLFATPAECTAVWWSMCHTLAALHRVDYEAVGLADFGRPGSYIARQLGVWTKQYLASKTHELPEMDTLIEWLPKHIPGDDETTIAHGDYRLGNLIIHPTEPRVIAVLDWELATLGHPLADLAYNCISYHLGPRGDLPSGAASGFKGLDLVAMGVPEEEEYVARYCSLTGRGEISEFDFYLAFSMFRLAAIVQGVYKRGLDGNASSEEAILYKPVVDAFADAALKQIAHRL